MRVILVLLLCCSAAAADDFHFEITASYWPLNPTGTVVTSTDRVDLKSDLGIQGRKSEPMLKVTFKPSQRQRLNFETVPYRLNGGNTVTRPFTFGGTTFPVHVTVSGIPFTLNHIDSKTEINYFFGGYQYDVVNNARGHAGIGASVAYFNAKAVAKITPSQTLVLSTTPALSGIEERSAAIPLIGGEFRYFIIPGKRLLNVNGEVKGMSLGSYGKYVQGDLNAGVAVMRFLRLQVGINVVDADVHNSAGRGFKLRFAGPLFSVQLHD